MNYLSPGFGALTRGKSTAAFGGSNDDAVSTPGLLIIGTATIGLPLLFAWARWSTEQDRKKREELRYGRYDGRYGSVYRPPPGDLADYNFDVRR